MRTTLFHLRETCVYAYLIGFYERFRWGDGFGRTHETNQRWNEAYDTGANHADWVRGWE